MSVRVQSPLAVAGLALTLGVLGDGLFRTSPWGLSFLVWGAALTGAVSVTWRLANPGERLPVWLAAPAGFAACLAWHDSPFLRFWDVVGMLVSLTLIALHARGVHLVSAGVFDYARNAVASGFGILGGAFRLLLEDTTWDRTACHPVLRRSTAALLGAALALPLVLLFGGLFMSADPVFERTVQALFSWDFASLSSHLMLSSVVAWLTAGYLRGLARGADAMPMAVPAPRSPALGTLEAVIVLGSLIVVFLSFVAVQARYLFGGVELVQSTVGLTYAEYARQGFFQLVAVVALVVPVLLIGAWVFDTSETRRRQSFRALAIVLIVLAGLVVVSALQRMRLYVDTFGLTIDRFYATAFMGWVAIVLGWLAATVLRGNGKRFVFGSILSGLGVLAVLHVLNPDALIARTNLARVADGHELDITYATRLSADAVPDLVAGITLLDDLEQCEMLSRLRSQPWTSGTGDWRSWNFARYRARRALERLDGSLQQPCGMLTPPSRSF